MKITHFIRNLEIGGLEAIVLKLAEIQRVHGNTVRVVCIEKERTKVLPQPNEAIIINKFNKINKTHALLRTMFELLRYRPDIINSHNVMPNVYGAIGGHLLKIPSILTLHSGEKTSVAEFNRKTNSLVKHIVCVSDQIALKLSDSAAHHISHTPRSEINNGIDVAQYINHDGSKLRAEFGFSSEDVVIGSVGRLQSVKNHKLLIDAVKSLSGKFGNLKVLLVGDGPLRKELERYASSLGMQNAIIFAGYRSDIPAILSAMDIFALPSLAEGSPIALLEAMAAKLPVIASAVGSIPKIIQNNVNGITVPPDDLSSFNSSLSNLVNNLDSARRLGSKGYHTVKSDHSMQKMYASYQEIYENYCHN